MAEARQAPAAVMGAVVAVIAGGAAVGFALWTVVGAVNGTSPVAWVFARASGVTSYLLLVTLVTTGLVLSHPWSRGIRRPSARTRLGLHVSLATFTLVFTVLHVAVLATDPWAQVGWRGAVLPMASTYRPVPVTLGVLALWAGLVTGVTARLAGSVAARVWWPVHKIAGAALVLVWAHSVLAGTDVVGLRGFYLATGFAVLGLAVTRYAARTPTDRVAELGLVLERSSVSERTGAGAGRRRRQRVAR
jgi:predicted ferric reductase